MVAKKPIEIIILVVASLSFRPTDRQRECKRARMKDTAGNPPITVSAGLFIRFVET